MRRPSAKTPCARFISSKRCVGIRRTRSAEPPPTRATNYEISVEPYRLFLDEDLHYSCAYFRYPERDTLEEAAPPAAISPFFQKYIFPGAHVPALSEVFSAIERSGLWTCDAEVLRLHYAYTIRHWRERFARNRAKAALIYGERFCRMWEIYLTSVELNFTYGESMVFQLLLASEKD